MVCSLVSFLTLAVFCQAGTSKMDNIHAYTMEKITFKSQGVDIVGNLFIPAGIDSGNKAPAVTIVGPVAFVKEQAPLQYATRLAQNGYVALIFDPRFHGESGGDPRRFESGREKTRDLLASIDYLTSRPEVEPAGINMLGICQGINWAIEASIQDSRIVRTAIVAGHYLMPELAAKYLGGKAAVDARIQKGEQARDDYEKTGNAAYIPVVSLEDKNAFLPAPHIHDWYIPWANRGVFFNYRGLWENRMTRMSEAELWSHNVGNRMDKLTTPTLMVHADHAASGKDLPRELFKRIPARDKKLVWLDNAAQFQFYEDPVVIDRTVGHLRNWF